MFRQCYYLNYISNYTGLEESTLRGKQIGWIAQEVEEIFPKCVKSQKMNWGTGNYDDFKTIDKSRLSDYTNGVLIKVINKVETLENENKKIKNENQVIKNENQVIKNELNDMKVKMALILSKLNLE